jgi:hypothetical protein
MYILPFSASRFGEFQRHLPEFLVLKGAVDGAVVEAHLHEFGAELLKVLAAPLDKQVILPNVRGGCISQDIPSQLVCGVCTDTEHPFGVFHCSNQGGPVVLQEVVVHCLVYHKILKVH